MGVTETSIALPAGGFCAARTARDIPHMRGYQVRRGLSASLREAKQSTSRHKERMDCFASLAMTVDTVSDSRDAQRPRLA